MANSFDDMFKNMMNEWRTRVDELKVQLNLGKMDAADAFEKQKDHLKDFINQAKQNLDKGTDMAEEQVKALRTKLEELRVQLSLGKADTMEAFEEQRKKIEPALHEVYESGKKAFNTTYEQGSKLFDHQSELFKTGLEVLQLQFALGKMEAKDEAEKLKKEISEKMEEMQTKAKEFQHSAMQNMEEWSTMAKDNMEKFRNWMQDIMKK